MKKTTSSLFAATAALGLIAASAGVAFAAETPVTEPSRKPAEQFAIIERVSPGPYLELFARRRPESNQPWAVWGDQVDSDIRIPGFAVPRYSERAHENEEVLR